MSASSAAAAARCSSRASASATSASRATSSTRSCGSVSTKSDIEHAFASAYIKNNQLFLYFGGDRYDPGTSKYYRVMSGEVSA